MSKRFLLSAIFAAGALSTGAIAGDMQVLNEEELEDVSAQGLQTIENDTRDFGGAMNQNNNLDSVQMNDNAQQNAKGADLVAAATSSVNVGINILWSDARPSEPDDAVRRDGNFPVVVEGPNEPQDFGQQYDQTNDQVAVSHRNRANATDEAYAYNEDKETQYVYNNVLTGNSGSSSVEGQDNNNNSVQLNDYAQQNVAGLEVENSAQSASNTGLNILATGTISLTSGNQENDQIAMNMDNRAEGGSYAYAGNYENSESTQSIDNVIGETGQDDNPSINVSGQDNNNNSVQLNGYAQENASGLTISNNANSAKNTGINLHASSGLIEDTAVSQTNDQRAHNHRNMALASTEDDDVESYAYAENYNKEKQRIVNGFSPAGSVSDQDNNNNSVQLNDNAQANATGLEIRNSAMSAYNTGMNIMEFDSSDNVILNQNNLQTAGNMNNYAEADEAYAGNAEGIGFYYSESPTQYVRTNTNVNGQNNNNNSVQLNDNAQQNAAALAMVNNANSAQNTGLNIMVDLIVEQPPDEEPPEGKGITLTVVNQTNDQVAKNHRNIANATDEAYAYNRNKQTQNIRNAEEIDQGAAQVDIVDQNNNNNSVQLNGNAQQNAKALEMTNMAVSAANTGMNIGVFNNINTSVVNQTNNQIASNFENTAVGGSYAQAGNEENWGEETVPGQYVHNVHGNISNQNNNNNSVQLNDNAQQNAEGLSIANIAKVALNSGINVMWVAGTTTDSEINQTNNQSAGNHNNYAETTGEEGVALAWNYNKQRQWIENCYCADINGQNNNQNSVQVNGNAQANLRGWHVLNGATSAVNMGTNIMATKGAVSGTVINQTNIQRATNFSNTATGTNATATNTESGIWY